MLAAAKAEIAPATYMRLSCGSVSSFSLIVLRSSNSLATACSFDVLIAFAPFVLDCPLIIIDLQLFVKRILKIFLTGSIFCDSISAERRMINLDESIGSRINSLIVSLGIKKVRFAEQIKVDQSYVTQLIKGRNYPSDRVIDNICRAFDVNEQWLRTGDGPMFVPIDKDKEFDRICMEIQLSDDEFIKDIMRKYWGLDENGKAIIRQMLAGLTDKKK